MAISEPDGELSSDTESGHLILDLFSRTVRSKFLLLISVFSSVQFSHSVVSNSLWPHGSQHARPPCPSPIPGVYSNSCPSSWWCHLAISSSIIPFASCPQSLPASGSFPMSQLFTWGGQSIGVSACYSSPNRLEEFLSWCGRQSSPLFLFRECPSGCSTSISLVDPPSSLVL